VGAVRRALQTSLRSLWTLALAQIRQRRPVILGYHGIASCHLRDDMFLLQVPPARFRWQLEMMRDAGFEFVTVAELVRELAAGRRGCGLAAVSFDDGMRNNRTTALPILRELGIRATVYVPTGWIGGRSPWISDAADNAILDREDIRDLADQGWEIGAHTVTHADLSRLGYDEARREIQQSCEDLLALTGTPVETFAYPFGRYGTTAVAAVRDSGLRAAVTTGARHWDPFELPRAMVGGADPYPLVLLKILDLYEPLLSSPPMRRLRTWSKRIRGDALRDAQIDHDLL
jgi:peptidoglycan/xylan/chitin deacetylase (PgdA/CDA1 family)